MNRSSTSAPMPTASGDVQLATFQVRGLFGQMDHEITFPTPLEGESGPSLVILHGTNGVGKTTVLRMIAGLMRLDFNPFRAVPFSSARLSFTTGEFIEVQPRRNEALQSLIVRYGDFKVELHPRTPGALHEEHQDLVEAFRRAFFLATDSVNFELIETTRIVGTARVPDTLEWLDEEDARLLARSSHLARRDLYNYYLHSQEPNPKARPSEPRKNLASKVQRFVQEAQVNYRRFFTTTEPDLFPKILQGLSDPEPREVTADELLSRLREIHEEDEQARELGLEPERWDYEKLASFLEERKGSEDGAHALIALNAYVETLESRAAERRLVMTRLQTFEQLVSEFFENKRLEIRPRKGFAIVTEQGEELSEEQLSSGEYHLLYLMVSALVTQRRGTVIAIDEPEMSMHLKWQSRLIGALMECASNAEPQFLFATHSPDIAAEYPDSMVMLGLSE